MRRVVLFLSVIALGAMVFPSACKRSAEPPTQETPAPKTEVAVSDEVRAAVEALSLDAPATIRAVVAVAEEARPLLREKLASGSAEQVATVGAVYVASTGRLPATDLEPALRSGDVPRRLAAVTVASQLGLSELVSPLGTLLRDSEPETVRVAAATALGRFDDSRVVSFLLPLLQNENGAVAEAAVVGLGQTPALTSLRPILALLKDTRAAVRRRAANVLALRRHPAGVEPVRALLDDEHPEVRKAAVQALAAMGGTQGWDLIAPRLAAEDPAERRFGVEALANFDPAKVREYVWKAAEDSDPLVRRAATQQLGRYDGNRLLPALLLARLDDQAASVRAAAIETASKLKRTRGVEAVVLALAERETHPEVFEAIVGYVRERENLDAALPALVRALRQKGATADGAAEALRELTGESFGTDEFQWRTWMAARHPPAGPDASGAADVTAPEGNDGDAKDRGAD